MARVARAIDHAHHQGVLHRDLKPTNILIDRDGVPHVGDFGLARRVDTEHQLTRTGAILGTPMYMAPEQAAASRGSVGAATDVYGLGAILYHTLTGRPPFQAASPLDTVLMVLELDPLPPRILNARADRTLEMIALKCLQKPTDLRYATSAALADDLEAYLEGKPVAARAGGFSQVLASLLRETHHAAVLENLGLLWMLHAAVILSLCLVRNYWQCWGVTSRWPYLALWSLGLTAWGAIFWYLRRRAGPVTFMERQLAHVWGACIAASIMLFAIEGVLGMPVLSFAPVLPVLGGLAFVIKAGMLSGVFYFQAAAMFATAIAMARWPAVGQSIFGVVSALCFFVPGLKYHRQRQLGGLRSLDHE